MWQKKFAELGSGTFTVVGIAMDIEGAAAAKQYYEKYGVKFHALADPNYATRFGYVPYTFFVNEHGVVQELRGWEQRIASSDKPKRVTDDIRRKFTDPNARTQDFELARLAALHENNPHDLATATELASRFLHADKSDRARQILEPALKHFDPLKVARDKDKELVRLLAAAHLQFARAHADNRTTQVQHATLSFYLNPSVGFGKQISRIIDPAKFDGRTNGRFDNRFREATLRRLQKQRRDWLADEK